MQVRLAQRELYLSCQTTDKLNKYVCTLNFIKDDTNDLVRDECISDDNYLWAQLIAGKLCWML